jgi:hypothetical protein
MGEEPELEFLIRSVHEMTRQAFLFDTELRIPVMQQVAAASQKSPLLHGCISCLLFHPLLALGPGRASFLSSSPADSPSE